MRIDFSKLFHRASKDLSDSGTVHIPSDSNLWPDAWKEIVYKTYSNLPQISLTPERAPHELFQLIKQRESRRDFSDTPLSLQSIAAVLKYSCGETGFQDGARRRAQPSAGGRYPIEAYVLNFRHSPDFPTGVYHYNVRNHALDILTQRSFHESDFAELFTYPWVREASAVIILTAVFERTQSKYGQRGYRYSCIEAGHIAQNAYLVAQALDIKCCALAGTYDDALERLLDIDGENESILHAVAFGL